MQSTRERIRQFNLAFGRPVNSTPTTPTVSERLLLGKLLLEETLETITKGLGLTLVSATSQGGYSINPSRLDLAHNEGDKFDLIETIDGQADVNVVNHFMAHWIGFNLDVATELVDDSNMSKLDPVTGGALINGVTPGYQANYKPDGDMHEPGFDPAKPIGKILKGPAYYDVQPVLRNAVLMGGLDND